MGEEIKYFSSGGIEQVSRELRLVDCHAHLEELEDPEAAIERAGKSGVLSIVAVGSDLESNQRVLSLSGRHGEVTVYAALGIHPWRLEGRDLEQDLAFMEKNLVRAVAIGEVGLDFWLKESRKDPFHRKRQEVVFRRLLSLGRALSKPVIIHARGAWAECLGMVLEEQVSKAVFHWKTGFDIYIFDFSVSFCDTWSVCADWCAAVLRYLSSFSIAFRRARSSIESYQAEIESSRCPMRTLTSDSSTPALRQC